MAERLTPNDAKRLPIKPKAYDVTVGDAPGLVLRVHPTGKRSFRIRYRIDGQRRWLVLGEFPDVSISDARKRARAVLGDVAKGNDVAQERQSALRERRKRRAGLTVAGLVERFMDEYSRPRKRSWAEDQRILTREVVEPFGTKLAAEFSKADVLTILDRLRHRGVGTGANTYFAAVRKLCAWAVSVDVLESNPCTGIEAPAPKRARDRVLSRDEVRRYWKLLPDAPVDPRVRLALMVQLCTGLRISEVTGARWIEVQTHDRKWSIPGERMKAGQGHTVPLTPLLVSLFEQTRALNPSEASVFVFESERRPGQPIGGNAVGRALNRLQREPRRSLQKGSAAERTDKPRRPYLEFSEPFTTHDVRRTMATELIAEEFEPTIVDRLLAHVPQGVLHVNYNRHRYTAEKSRALEHWQSIITSNRPTAEVVA